MGLNVFTPREKMNFFFGQTIKYLRYLILLTDDWNCVTQVYTSISNTDLGTKKQFCYILFSFVKTKKNGTL